MASRRSFQARFQPRESRQDEVVQADDAHLGQGENELAPAGQKLLFPPLEAVDEVPRENKKIVRRFAACLLLRNDEDVAA